MVLNHFNQTFGSRVKPIFLKSYEAEWTSAVVAAGTTATTARIVVLTGERGSIAVPTAVSHMTN